MSCVLNAQQTTKNLAGTVCSACAASARRLHPTVKGQKTIGAQNYHGRGCVRCLNKTLRLCCKPTSQTLEAYPPHLSRTHPEADGRIDSTCLKSWEVLQVGTGCGLMKTGAVEYCQLVQSTTAQFPHHPCLQKLTQWVLQAVLVLFLMAHNQLRL